MIRKNEIVQRRIDASKLLLNMLIELSRPILNKFYEQNLWAHYHNLLVKRRFMIAMFDTMKNFEE